jgi:hypothetical protein
MVEQWALWLELMMVILMDSWKVLTTVSMKVEKLVQGMEL